MAKRSLTDEQVVGICEDLNSGKTLKDVADKYGVSQAVIYQIQRGKSYSSISIEYLFTYVGNGKKRGEDHARSKLTEKQVREIRSMERIIGNYKLVVSLLSEAYGVTPRNIRAILSRETWKHID